MKRIVKISLLTVVVLGLATSCFKDNDDNLILASEISDFVWKGMNAAYLYKEEIPDLANDRFATNDEYGDYLNSFSSPEELFESVVYQRSTIDRFSWITDDYIALEQLFSGVTKSNGMEYGLVYVPNGNNAIFGYVRYVLPNTSAQSQGVQRGDIFYAVNGESLYYNSPTDNNLGLLNANNYTINLATYNNNGTPETSDDSVTPGSGSISLTKADYTENPILTHSILQVEGNNVGYLMYNGFTGTNTFDSALNSVFGEFQAAGITDLILDLRYNPGGSVRTATWLASMITGQFTGSTFVKEQWNSEIQAQIIADDPNLLLNPFVNQMIKTNSSGAVTFQQNINHVNLSRVYVLTTKASASASELIINGLDPYINVIQVGKTTTGKYQASVTLYDSPNFGRQNANPNHTYAIQPLVFKSLNANDVTDYFNGLSPDIEIAENYGNLGVLGNPSEPLLAAAIGHIEGTGRLNYTSDGLEEVKDSNDLIPFAKEMYSDKPLPFIKKN